MQLLRGTMVLFGCIATIAFTGCPDRSYMRPAPDYSEHADPSQGDGEDGEEEVEDRNRDGAGDQ